MKLQQLTIHNIASIEDATIHFDRQPLAGSEVFLITGKTGAGKSTILDAICLALYADTPRLDNTNMQGNLADLDKEVRVNDPRQLMRRNTGEAYVRLLFTGINGLPYEATWSVARAKNKRDGNLQAKKWCLRNLQTDFSYSKDEEIKQEIRRAIGLDFKQFCRTTMLAQGEFTRFLNSKDDEKAEILEKITGVSIYSRIGAKIFEMTKERKTQWESAEQRAQSVRIMSDEELQAKRQECGLLEQSLDRNKAAREVEQAKCTWFARESELAQESSSARRALAETEERIRSEAFQKSMLLTGQWRKTQEARGWAADCQEAHACICKQTQALEGMFLDYLTLARALDETRDTGERNAKETRRLQAMLDAEAPLVPIYEQEQYITSRLETMTECTDRALGKAEEARRMTATIEKVLMPKRDEAQKRLDAQTASQALLGKETAREEAALEQFHLPRMRQQSESLATLMGRVAMATQDIDTCVNESNRARTLRQKMAETEKEARQKRQEANLLTPKIHDATLVVQTLQEAHEKEREKASDWARRLRVRLHVGDTCPVCLRRIDSTLPHEDALAELVAESEQRLAQAVQKKDALVREQQTLEATVRALETSLSLQRAEMEGARHLATALEKARLSVGACLAEEHCQQFHIDQEEARHALQGWVSLMGQDISGDDGAHASPEDSTRRLRALLKSMDQEAREEAERLRQRIAEAERKEQALRRLKADQDALRVTQERLSAALQEAEKAIERGRGELKTIQATRELLEANRQQAMAQVETLMGKHEGSHSWKWDWKESPKAFAQELKSATLAHNKRTEELKRLGQEQEKLEARLAHMRATLDTIESLAPEWATRPRPDSPAPGHSDYDSIMQQASTLLGRIGSAQEQLRQARQRMTEREGLLREYSVAHQPELNNLATLMPGHIPDDAATQDVAMASLNWLNSMSLPEIEEAEKRASEVLGRQIKQQALLQEAERQRGEHLLRKPTMSESETPETLQERLRTLQAEADELARRKGGLLRDLEVDSENRRTAGKLKEEARLKEELYLRWERLNQLLGDATGSKFRKIAQSYVLANLLHAANCYLRTLTERYSLQVKPGSFAISLSDAYQGYTTRAATTLSGGESFLVSLSLALALSDIDSRLSVDTLFIDEGFGTLSGEPLQNAISTLRSLHTKAGKHVGIISHVEELKECIPVQIQVNQEGNNSSSQVVVVG